MDECRFDTLARTLTAGSRREVLRCLLAATVGILSTRGGGVARAHNPASRCKRIRKRAARKKCLKRAKVHNAQHVITPVPYTLEPADAATRELLLSAAKQSAEHAQLTDHLSQVEEFTRSGEAEAWRVVIHDSLARIVLVEGFARDDGNGAFLAFGEEETGTTWAVAYLVEADALQALLVVSAGEIERIETPVSENGSRTGARARERGASEFQDELQMLVATLGDKCFQCEALCQLGVDHAIVGEILGIERKCASLAASLCSKVASPVPLAICAAGVWSGCYITIDQIQDQLVELGCHGACANTYSCEPQCMRQDCPADDEIFSKTLCRCQCIPALEDLDLDKLDTPRERCGGRCVYTDSDPNHCGACERVCGDGAACVGGECQGEPDGFRFVKEWGAQGDADGQFNIPRGVALDGANNVFVADSFNHRVQEFTGDGAFLAAWGQAGSQPGEFSYPQGLAFDGDGNLYVADSINNRIQKFDANAAFVLEWGVFGTGPGQFQSPYGVAVDGQGNVYIADVGNDRIQQFDAGGGFLAEWGGEGTDPAKFRAPTGVAVDGEGNVYVADQENHRIQKFDAAKEFLLAWGSAGSEPDQFLYPTGIATDGSNRIYVVDFLNGRVQQFESDGTFLASIGQEGTGPGELHWPEALGVDSAGNVYVADTEQHRIQKFAPTGRSRIATEAVLQRGQETGKNRWQRNHRKGQDRQAEKPSEKHSRPRPAKRRTIRLLPGRR